jgi:hypothetical protein
MIVVLLFVLMFMAFGLLCAVLSIPAIIWAGVAICRPGTRLVGFGILLAGAAGVAAAWLLVLAIHRQWLPMENILLCWFHFVVPTEQPYRFFFAWAPMGFVVPAMAVAMATGGRCFWKRIKKEQASDRDRDAPCLNPPKLIVRISRHLG